MSNHIHVVVQDCPTDGAAVRRVLKGVTQTKLSEAMGKSVRWWTHKGSDRYKNDDGAIEAAIRYVANQDGMLAGVKNNVAFQV